MFSQKILFPKWSPLQEQLQPKCHLYWSLHLSAYIVSLVASFVAQLVKNLPALQETWVRSLGWEDPLEKVKATHSSILAWRIPWTVSSTGLQRHDATDTTEQLSLIQHLHQDILLNWTKSFFSFKTLCNSSNSFLTPPIPLVAQVKRKKFTPLWTSFQIPNFRP